MDFRNVLVFNELIGSYKNRKYLIKLSVAYLEFGSRGAPTFSTCSKGTISFKL